MIFVEDNISIKKSNINYAGNGAFANKDIPNGGIIEICRDGKLKGTTHGFCYNDECFILDNCKSIYMNDIINLRQSVNTCRLVYKNLKYNVILKRREDVICAVASRDIKMGDELYINYGSNHWLNHISNLYYQIKNNIEINEASMILISMRT